MKTLIIIAVSFASSVCFGQASKERGGGGQALAENHAQQHQEKKDQSKEVGNKETKAAAETKEHRAGGSGKEPKGLVTAPKPTKVEKVHTSQSGARRRKEDVTAYGEEKTTETDPLKLNAQQEHDAYDPKNAPHAKTKPSPSPTPPTPSPTSSPIPRVRKSE